MKAKPCPFCGSTSISVNEGSTFLWRYASCDECGAASGEVRVQTLGEGSKDEWESDAATRATEEWNTRAYEAEIDRLKAYAGAWVDEVMSAGNRAGLKSKPEMKDADTPGTVTVCNTYTSPDTPGYDPRTDDLGNQRHRYGRGM